MFDLAAATPLGLTALCYGLAGYAAGFALSITVDPNWWLGMIFVIIGAAVGEATQPVVYSFIGENGWLTDRMFWVVPIVALSAGLISPIAIPLGRWCLGIKKSRWKALPE